jgi:hypothetical protein
LASTTAGTAATDTITAGDIITLTGTNNTLNVTVTGTDTNAINGANVSGVQTVNIRATDAATPNVASFNAGQIAGLTKVNSNLSGGTVTVTGLASGAAIGVIGNGTLANGITNFAYASATGAQIINLQNGVTAGAINATASTGVTTATINSTGASNVTGIITLASAANNTVTSLTINAATSLRSTLAAADFAATAAITVSGAASALPNSTAVAAVDLTGAAVNVRTIDASGLTAGGVGIALGTNTTSFKGGAGNDVVTSAALGASVAAGAIDAGAGTADVLILNNVTDANTTTLAGRFVNFETLRYAGILDVSLLSGISTIQVTGASTVNNISAAQSANLQAFANATVNNLTLALTNSAGTSDSLTLRLGTGITNGAAASTGVITAVGVETINLVALPGATATAGANRISTITGAISDTSLTAVNLTGTSFVFTDISSTKAVTWDATALTGDGSATPIGLSITGGTTPFAGSLVKGSAFRDTITIAAATGGIFQGNGGNDIFTTTSTILTPTGAATDVTIDGGAGTSDSITLSAAAVITDTSFSKTTNMENLVLIGGANSESITGLAANASAAYATGITVTEAAIQTNATNLFTWSSGLYNQNVSITHGTAYTGAAVGGNQSITTGGGNDTINMAATAWVGGANNGTIVISTGAGVDTISISTGALATASTARIVTITAGTGADVINVTAGTIQDEAGGGVLNSISFVTGAGDSTTTAYDSITGFRLGTAAKISDAIDFAGASAITTYAATAATGYTAAQLTVAVSGAAGTLGAVAFAGTSAATLTLAEKIAAIQSVVVGTAGDTCFFIDSGNTYVFNNNTTDSVVQLIGVSGVLLSATNVVGAGNIAVL